MSDIDKRSLSERDICTKFITPALRHAGWDEVHQRYYAANATGVSPSMKDVSREVTPNLPIPLPHLAEQHRILARVGALMTLCDRLGSTLHRADATRARLLDTLIHEALSPAALEVRETAA